VKRQGKEMLPRGDHPHQKVSAGPIAHGRRLQQHEIESIPLLELL
jgi:hypothetical protein